jgi:hypothetical protein
MTFDIKIRYYTRYQVLWNSISSALNLKNIDIEGRNIRYRSSMISKNCQYRSTKDRYRLITISKKRRYRSSKLRNRYIPISKISRYRKMLLRYLFTISKIFSCSSISVFFVGSSLGCLLVLGTGHRDRLRCAHCIANQSLPVAHVPPGPPSAPAAEAAVPLHSARAARRPHPLHRAQHRPQSPERGSAAGAAAAAAGAGINGERLIRVVRLISFKICRSSFSDALAPFLNLQVGATGFRSAGGGPARLGANLTKDASPSLAF